MKQIPLAIGPEPARTFENFLSGANGGALAHLLALAPGAPPVYLWGPEGSGKTHLLHAVVERAAGHGRHAAWFSAATPLPWTSAADREWLVIDDAHALDPAQQQAAFSLFVDAADRAAGIVRRAPHGVELELAAVVVTCHHACTERGSQVAGERLVVHAVGLAPGR